MPATKQRKPISGRVSEDDERQLRALARQERRTVSQVLARLVEEGLRMRRHPGITFVDGPQGRRAHLAGTGFDAWEVVALYRAYEGVVARLLGDHPGLDRREIEIAVAYGEAHRDEIEGFLTENDQAG